MKSLSSKELELYPEICDEPLRDPKQGISTRFARVHSGREVVQNID
jgi:hypothetical protein